MANCLGYAIGESIVDGFIGVTHLSAADQRYLTPMNPQWTLWKCGQ